MSDLIRQPDTLLVADETYAPPSRPGRLSREEEAKLALEHTRISRPVALLLTLAFLVTICGVPIYQQVSEVSRNLAARRQRVAEHRANGQPVDVATMPLAPQSWDVFRTLPWAQPVDKPRDLLDLLFPPAQRLRDYETALEDGSWFNQRALPPAQWLLTGLGGVGNEQAYRGRDGWLFFRPDVEYVTSHGFLDPAALRARQRTVGAEDAPVHPDPIAAITRFSAQLKERGITLVVMPVPVKPMLHPEQFAGRFGGASDVLQNPSYAECRRRLEAQGVRVLDVTGPLQLAKRGSGGAAQFLAADTHWTPEAMDLSARVLAAYLEGNDLLPKASPAGFTRAPVPVSHTGDIADMLKLPPGQTLYRPQTVTVQQVRQPDGALWKPQHGADVLLLGDSFANIFATPGLRWGESAGLAEQLSYHLQRPVDRIAQNAGGAYATRQQLAAELEAGQERLFLTRVVVYEFAMREFASGDWKPIDLPAYIPPPPVPIATPSIPDVLAVTKFAPATINTGAAETVTLELAVPPGIDLRVGVRTMAGVEVRALNAARAGSDYIYRCTWDGRDGAGLAMPTGSYLFTVIGVSATGKPEKPITRKVTVIAAASKGVVTLTGITPERINPNKGEIAGINFILPTSAHYRVVIRNSAGKEVQTFTAAEARDPGAFTQNWDGQSKRSTPVPDGAYSVVVEATTTAGSMLVPAKGTVTVSRGAPPVVVVHPPPPIPTDGKLIVRGKIVEAAKPPKPGSVAYKDCLIGVMLDDVQATQGTIAVKRIQVYVWGMRDGKWTDAARYIPGQTITLTLTPWEKAAATYETHQRVEVESPDAMGLDTYWGELP